MVIYEWWKRVCPSRDRDLDLEMRPNKPPELSSSRHLLHLPIAAWTGHGEFTAYHRRFNQNDTTLEFECGPETS